MRMSLRLVCICLLVVLVGSVRESFAGIVMERVMYKKGSVAKQKGRIYISKNKIKFTDENEQTVAILDLNSGEMIQVDNAGKRYTVAKPEDYFKFIEETTVKMKAEIEKQLSKLPPEQRAQMEEMMKSRGLLPSDRVKQRKLVLKKTDVFEKIAGYNSRKYEVYEDGRLIEEIWVSKDVGFDKEVDMKKLANYMMEIKKIGERAGFGYSGLDDQEKEFQEIYESGFPMRSVDYSPSGDTYIEEVTRIQNTSIPDQEFEIPSGYKKVTLEELMLPNP